MEIKNKVIPEGELPTHIYNKTSMQYARYQEFTRMALDAKADSKQKQRLAYHECKVCFYLSSRVGGSAITESNCTVCDAPISNASTNVDKVCRACAEKYRLCVHCGGDLELVVSRKKLVYK